MFNLRCLTTAIAVCSLATPLAAQGARQDVLATPEALVTVAAPLVVLRSSAPTVRSLGPTVQSGIAGVRTNVDQPVLTPAAADPHMRRNPALMLVGGAALIVGAVIGGRPGTIVMVGGGIVGLVGLWNYLQ